VNRQIAQELRSRAKGRCEYCHLPASIYPLPFHVDHIVASQHGGKTVLENLALACLHCHRHKGPNIAGTDPETGEMTRLFHPRQHVWSDHFMWNGAQLSGRTGIGRVTIHVLAINH
jgi:5-methylcytosine-specific restriction endonuclease McrA